MKTLYLAPPSENPSGALAYTFLDEEAEGLREAGVDVYVIATHGEDREIRGLHVRALPPGKQLGERLGTPAFLMRHRAAFPARMGIRGWAHAFHLARIERFAARLVREENISVI